ncbi:MAG: DEAD/DEAH box helicase [Alphaproteobacteria bacterium]|nr:DEAD/DEAH box helicase [Alphaproteobacteria bacterium]
MKFEELGLAAPILKALTTEGYTTPTPIQGKAIPPVLEGSDLLGIAQTGTGKTAAFALPILTRLQANPKPNPRKGCRALVLSPTRELASQIAESFRVYGSNSDVKVAVVFGGVDIRKQIRTMATGVDVLVATPGRLIDHVGQRTIDLSGTEIFVLDEADQMLDLGFVKPIRRIANMLSKNRQNLFFSATMPKEISGLADDLLNEPVKVSVAPVATTAERIDQQVIHVEQRKKRSLLVELFGQTDMGRTLVFTRTKRGADRVARHLETAGFPAAAIHGNKSQRQREKALESFKKSNIQVLVATDIAARGIDIDGVSHVVNFELPEVPEAYVHRIGRTARAGASGKAISLCDSVERNLLRAIEKLTRQTIPSENRCNDETLEAQKEPARNPGSRQGRGGDRGRNGSGRAPSRGGERRSGPGRAQGNGASRNGSSRSANGAGGEASGERAWSPVAAGEARWQGEGGKSDRGGRPARSGARPSRNGGGRDRTGGERSAERSARENRDYGDFRSGEGRGNGEGRNNGGRGSSQRDATRGQAGRGASEDRGGAEGRGGENRQARNGSRNVARNANGSGNRGGGENRNGGENRSANGNRNGAGSRNGGRPGKRPAGASGRASKSNVPRPVTFGGEY